MPTPGKIAPGQVAPPLCNVLQSHMTGHAGTRRGFHGMAKIRVSDDGCPPPPVKNNPGKQKGGNLISHELNKLNQGCVRM